MKYLALIDKGAIHSLGDCGDWESANEVAEDCELDYFYMTTLEDWIEIADDIKEQQKKTMTINEMNDAIKSTPEYKLGKKLLNGEISKEDKTHTAGDIVYDNPLYDGEPTTADEYNNERKIMVSTATIKLSKAEIDRVVRSLVVSIRISDVFDYNGETNEKANFTTLKDDFVKIKRMLDDGEQEYRNGDQTENGYHTVKVCETCE